MAITHVEFTLFSALRETGQLPASPHVLELGKNNWYGDVPVSLLARAISQHVADDLQRQALLADLDRHAAGSDEPALYALADLFLRAFTGCASLSSIDPGLPHSTWKLDLNQPVPLRRQFDVVLNSGTAQHVFNVFQFFKTAHDLTVPGGLMIHGVPFTGWVDDGFFNFQPTFFWDLAYTNGYELAVMLCAELAPPSIVQLRTREDAQQLAAKKQVAENTLLYAVFRKPRTEREFAPPLQGCYQDQLRFEAA